MANYQNVTPIKLGQAAILATVTTVYIAPALSRIYLKNIDVANTTNASKDLNIYLVPAGGTAGTGNAIAYTIAVPAYTTYQWRGVQIMNPSDTLQVLGSATGLTITASGGQAT
jgi:hypothetical protein